MSIGEMMPEGIALVGWGFLVAAGVVLYLAKRD